MVVAAPTRRLSADETEALNARYRGARVVLRENPGMDDAERYDLLAAVVAPRDPLLGLGSSVEEPDPPPHRHAGRLTPRQTEIVTLLSHGHLAREIGEALGINEGNVREQLKQIRRRMGVTTTAAAVAAAIRRGLIS